MPIVKALSLESCQPACRTRYAAGGWRSSLTLSPCASTASTIASGPPTPHQGLPEVPKLLEDMKTRRITPNVYVSKKVITSFVEYGDMSGALEFFELVPTPDLEMYDTLLHGCLRAGAPRMAEHLLQEMMLGGIAPSTFSLSCVVKLKGLAKEVDESFDIVNYVTRKYSMKADAPVNDTLIQACLRNGKIHRGVAAFERMVQNRAELDYRSFEALLCAVLDAADVMLCAKLLRAASGMSSSGSPWRVGYVDALLPEVAAALRRGGHEASEAELVADLRAGAHEDGWYGQFVAC